MINIEDLRKIIEKNPDLQEFCVKIGNSVFLN